MSFSKHYPHFAPVENHIRAAGLQRTVAIAEGIAGFVVDCWNAIQQPPAPPAITPIDRRRTVRHNAARAMPGAVHR